MTTRAPIVLLRRAVEHRLRRRDDAWSFGRAGGGVDTAIWEDLGSDPDTWHRLSRRPMIVVDCLEGDRSFSSLIEDVRSLAIRLRDHRVESERVKVSLSVVVCFLDRPASEEPGEIAQADLRLFDEFLSHRGRLCEGVDHAVKRLHVMTPRLHDAAGGEIGLIDAADAWPLAVDRLIAALCVRGDELLEPDPFPLRAWRVCELLTPWEAPSWARVRQQFLKRIWPSFSEGDPAATPLSLSSLGEQPTRTAPEPAPRAKIPYFASAGSIFGQGGFASEVEAAYEDRRVGKYLRQRVEPRSRLAPLAEAAVGETRARWMLVRESPGNLDGLRNVRRRVEEADALAEMLETIHQLRSHHRRVDGFQRRVADLEEAGQELDLARRHWLVWWWRLAVAIVVAMLGGYVVAGVIRPLTLVVERAEDGLPAILQSPIFTMTTAAAVAGAVAGALIPYLLERHRGERARAMLDSGADSGRGEYSDLGATPTQQALEMVGDSLDGLMENAARLRRASREIATASLLRWGAERLGRVKERAVAEVIEPSPSVQRAEPRDRYARTVRLRCSPEAAESALDGTEAERIRPEAEQKAQAVLLKRWKVEGPRLDPLPAGLWPAHPAFQVLQGALMDARREGERVIVLAGLEQMEQSPTTLDEVVESFKSGGQAMLGGDSLLTYPLLSVRYNVRGRESGGAAVRTLIDSVGTSAPRVLAEQLGLQPGNPQPGSPLLPPMEALASWVEEVALDVVPEGDHLEFIAGSGREDGA